MKRASIPGVVGCVLAGLFPLAGLAGDWPALDKEWVLQVRHDCAPHGCGRPQGLMTPSEIKVLPDGEQHRIYYGRPQLYKTVAGLRLSAGPESWTEIYRNGRLISATVTVQARQSTRLTCGGPLSGHGSGNWCDQETLVSCDNWGGSHSSSLYCPAEKN